MSTTVRKGDSYYCNDVLHREDGPATVCRCGYYPSCHRNAFYWEGRHYSIEGLLK